MIFVSHLKSKHSCLPMSSLNDVHIKRWLNRGKRVSTLRILTCILFLLDLNDKLKLPSWGRNKKSNPP